MSIDQEIWGVIDYLDNIPFKSSREFIDDVKREQHRLCVQLGWHMGLDAVEKEIVDQFASLPSYEVPCTHDQRETYQRHVRKLSRLKIARDAERSRLGLPPIEKTVRSVGDV